MASLDFRSLEKSVVPPRALEAGRGLCGRFRVALGGSLCSVFVGFSFVFVFGFCWIAPFLLPVFLFGFSCFFCLGLQLGFVVVSCLCPVFSGGRWFFSIVMLLLFEC